MRVRSSLRLAVLGLATSFPLAAQSLTDKVELHGYLTQGFGVATESQILGIPTAGTSEYRAAALQARFKLSPKDNLVIQLNHRRLGLSVLNEEYSDVYLNWGYYQRRVGNGSIKVGRTPIPRGIYNEIRFVGTLLPFYRAPFNNYTENLETIDGLVASQRVSLGGDWSLDMNGYLGQTNFTQAIGSATAPNPPGRILIRNRADRLAGTYLWLNTPQRGLRIGGGANVSRYDRFDIEGRTTPVGGYNLFGAVDGSFEKFYVRSEFFRFKVNTFKYDALYVQTGVHLSPKVSLHAQWDGVPGLEYTTTAGGLIPPTLVSYKYADDYAAGLTFSPSANLRFRGEGHYAKGFAWDGPAAVGVPSLGGTPTSGTYWLASVSLSF